jgi:hypothetical protein
MYAVYAVSDCDKADAEFSKQLHVHTDLDVVAPEARQILHNAAFHVPGFHFRDKLLPAFALKTGAFSTPVLLDL